MVDGPNPRDLDRRENAGVQVTVREQSGGLLFGIGGLLLAAFASWRVFSIVPVIFGGLADCGAPAELTLGTLRASALVATISGIIAVALSEIGVRRDMKPRVIGTAGSVLGVFAAVAGAIILAMLLVSDLAECFVI